MANELTKFIRWQSEGKKQTKTANAAFDSEVSFRWIKFLLQSPERKKIKTKQPRTAEQDSEG